MSEVLEAKNLNKKFNNIKAVDNISFSVLEGQVIGLLGANGAGKTTTIQILMGITDADSGQIKYFGKDFFSNRKFCLSKINFSSAYNNLQQRITVWENLMVFAMLYGIDNPKSKIMKLLDYFEIKELINEEFINLSSGQKTRVNLVKALINNPRLILMDEPTASLDPDIADKTLSLIEKLRHDRKLSILYTSHNMSEVERICDQVIFLERGKIVACNTPLQLTKKIKFATVSITFDGEEAKLKKLLIDKKIHFSFIKKHIVQLKITDKELPNMLFKISNIGIWITDISIKKPSLEDVFLQIARGKYE